VADAQTDWEDLPPQKTAWNIKGEEGWWTVVLRGADERVSVKLKGRFTKVRPVYASAGSVNSHSSYIHLPRPSCPSRSQKG
jgi:hypothetical protein